VGPLSKGSTTVQRFAALRVLGHQIEEIDSSTPLSGNVAYQVRRLSYHLFRLGLSCFGDRDRHGENTAIIRQVSSVTWDVLWIDKGLTIEAETLSEVRRLQPDCRIVGFSPDDMYARHNQSRPFLQSLPQYDVFFTTKSYGVQELESLGARNVIFVGNAYSPEVHRPIDVSSAERMALGGPVGFIGSYETERAASMRYLQKNGIHVRIWGNGWNRGLRSQGIDYAGAPLWDEDFAKGICAFDINLAFLRKINRDLQTTRSVEIPACGAFMLAERTEEHQALFEEGKEAEYFASDEELLDKVRYYLAHEDERKSIAAAGRERCIRSGYSNAARLSKMLETVMMGS
jgi:hypothetical protein